MPGSGLMRRRSPLVKALLVVGVVSLLAAGCGSSGKSSSGSAGSTNKLSGAPITVMTLGEVNSPGLSYPQVLEAPKLYEQWINSHGGIKGHPLNVITCDDQGDATKAAQCGRTAILDKVVAVVGSNTLNGNAVIPELAAAHIAWFGICCALSEDEFTSPDVFQIGDGYATPVASAVKAAVDGCKKIALVTINEGSSLDNFLVQLVSNALKAANGPPLMKTVLIPLQTQDYAPEVQQATSGTDCIVAPIPQNDWSAWMPSYATTGAHQRLYGAQGNLDATIAKAFPQATQGAVVAGNYSDLSLSPWNDYRAAMAQFHAPAYDYNGLAGLGTWAGYVAFNQVASSMTAPINSANFLAAAKAATVRMNGMTADVQFTPRWDGLGGNFPNAVNRSVTYDIIKNGKLVAFQNGKFYDITNAMTGQPLPPADTPPAGE